MEEIKKLDEKYLVIKLEDLERYFSQLKGGMFATDEEQAFKTVLDEINKRRKALGKRDNRYVVLNLEDEVNINYLILRMVAHKRRLTTPYISIEDLSIDLVNAVLMAGNP